MPELDAGQLLAWQELLPSRFGASELIWISSTDCSMPRSRGPGRLPGRAPPTGSAGLGSRWAVVRDRSVSPPSGSATSRDVPFPTRAQASHRVHRASLRGSRRSLDRPREPCVVASTFDQQVERGCRPPEDPRGVHRDLDHRLSAVDLGPGGEGILRPRLERVGRRTRAMEPCRLERLDRALA